MGSLAEAKLPCPQELSHCERESLILNEALTCCFSSASSASRKDTRPDSPRAGGIKLAFHVDTFICKMVLARSCKGRGETV